MPKAGSEKQSNNFVKGLITEASALTFPENASLDEDNFVLQRTGKRTRRLGVDYETNYVYKATGIDETILQGSRQSIHSWESPSGDTNITIGVVRVYNKLWFVNLLNDSPSTEFLNNGDPLIIAGLLNARINTTVINNDLVIVSDDLSKPIALKYDRVTEVVTQSQIEIKVRDIWGVDDTLDVTERPTTLTDTHKYNLRNQGWSTTVETSCGTDPITCTFSTNGKYPSNADIWTYGKVSDATAANYEKYDPAVLLKNSTQNAQAPQGYYVIDAFARGASRETLSGTTLPVDADSGSITTVESFSGRVFYSGINSNISGSDDRSPSYNSYVFFSQFVTSNEHLGKCYMDADPTDNQINDLIDTDGGTIQIPGVTKIIRLAATKSSLIVFAQNGVWEIFGDTGGFTATSFQVSKISSVGMISPDSVIEVNGVMVYWSLAGIYLLTQDNITGRFKAENVSIKTVQTFYNDLSSISKENAIGFFEEQENRVRWLFNTEDGYGLQNYINRYNRELVFDITLGAFYPNTISALASDSPKITGYAPIPTFSTSGATEFVFVDNEQVIADAEEVVIPIIGTANRTNLPLFLTFKGASFTFSSYKNTTFYDWVTEDTVGANYTSFLITGQDTMGDLMRKKSTPYLFMYFDRTEDGFTDVGGSLIADNQSSCIVQAQWNWADSAASGKWGSSKEMYRYRRPYFPADEYDTYDWGESVIKTKNKLRGTGTVLSLYMKSSAGKDCRILGWAILIEAAARP